MLGRLARDLPAFVRQPLTLDAARAGIRQRLATREQSVLFMLEHAVFAQPQSPYNRLLALAACEPGDVRAMLAREGLAGTLTRLAAAGVYVAFDEFKGRGPVVRGSQRLWFEDWEFDNPRIRPHYLGLTGGSRGRPNRIPRSLASFDGVASFVGVALAAHGIEQSRHLLWLNGPADWMMMFSRLGRPIEAWYHPVRPLAWQIGLGSRYLAAVGHLGGYSFPLPRFRDMRDPARMARILAARQAGSPRLVVTTIVSQAVRVASEAERLGLDLSGVTFIAEGEPMTPARHQQLLACGAQVIANYGSIELNTLGYSCAGSTAPDDLHFAADRYAVVQHERETVVDGPLVDALLFTSISSTDPKMALNVELGDVAVVEERDCGCQLGALGLRTHLSQVRSFEKLSGEGVTFARSELTHLLEEILPRAFGGTSLDYQLVEEEAATGIARFVLRVSPSVGPVDEAAVCARLLAELGRGGPSTHFHAALLAQAGTLQVLRASPLATRVGKVLPFYVAPKRTP